jgi:hypothetical protein
VAEHPTHAKRTCCWLPESKFRWHWAMALQNLGVRASRSGHQIRVSTGASSATRIEYRRGACPGGEDGAVAAVAFRADETPASPPRPWRQ